MAKYTVKLSLAQREQLEDVVRKGDSPAFKIMRAHILLKTDAGEKGPRWKDSEIRSVFGVGTTTMKNVRKRFVEEGLSAAIERKEQPKRPEKQKLTGEKEAKIIAVLCTENPEGSERWTLRALRERAIELEIVDTISYETIRKVLKKTR